MSTFADPSQPPSGELLLKELRAIWELGAFFSSYPLLRLAPRGDGHPVLVLPGLGASDSSTRPLRRYLQDQGWNPHGWGLGANRGPRGDVPEQLLSRFKEIHQRYGRKVSLLGWSLGGVMARELAREAPDAVRQVITLGSPFAGHPRASNAWKLYEKLSGRAVEDRPEFMPVAPPVPCTAIYSRSDGIVAWQGCLEAEAPNAENIEVEGSHCGLGHNPTVLYAVADRLAQIEGKWRPFDRNGLKAAIYRNPLRDAAGRAAAQRRSRQPTS
jgi:pimeloyl-ACP methyl ester carboxylesterase